MADTIIQQGRFTSDGTSRIISIRSDADWMEVYNENATIQVANDRPVSFYWQRGMAAGRGLKTVKLGTVAADPLTSRQITVGLGFTLVNQGTDAVISTGVTATAITNNAQPVVTTADTSLIKNGDVIRLSQTPANRDVIALLGIDFQVDTVTLDASFRIANALQQATGAGANNSVWRKVNIDSIFYPKFRYIVDIDSVTDPLRPVITTSVDHGYIVGQEVRFHVSSTLNGMIEINQLSAPITAVTASTFDVDLDTNGFTAFAFPTSVAVAGVARGYTPATVAPLGEDTATALSNGANILSDASLNVAIIGMNLSAGTVATDDVGPAGENGDVMYWRAGKSFSVSN